jgi:hypothetical protein
MNKEVLLQFYVNNILSLALFYFIGFSVTTALKVRFQFTYKNIFYQFIIGISLLVMGVAIYKTSGKTIFIIMFFPILLLLYYLKQPQPISNNKNRNPIEIILSILTICGIVTAMMVYKYYDAHSLIPTLPHIDYIQYAKLSKYIWETGNENFNIDYINLNDGITPYHYFEIWINSALANLFGTNDLLQLVLGSYVIGIVLVWLGIMMLAEQSFKIKSHTFVLCFILLFISGLYLDSYKKITLLSLSGTFAVNTFTLCKLFPIYLFVCIIIAGNIEKKNILFVIGAMFLSLSYVSTFPIIYGAMTLYFGYLFFLKKERSVYKYFVILSTLIILIVLFYFLFTSKNVSQISVLNSEFLSLSYIKTLINIIGGSLIQLGILFFPFWILFLLNYKQILAKCFDLFFLLFAVIALGLLTWGFLHRMDNSVQLFSNIAIPFIILGIITCIFLVFQYSTIYFKFFTTLYIVTIVLINSYAFIHKEKKPTNQNYISNVVRQTKNLNQNCAFLYNEIDYKTYFSKISNYSTPAKFLALYDCRINPISLSVFDIPIDINSVTHDAEKKLVETSIFYRYVENKKKKGLFLTVEDAQIDFIKEHNIQYLFTSRNVILNDKLSKIVSLKYVNKITGEHFYLINL